MQIPQFIVKENKWKEWNNLLINCENQREFYSYLNHLGGYKHDKECFDCTIQFEPIKSFSLLSPYYFKQSKNDPENHLKYILTRTYTSNGDYINPISWKRDNFGHRVKKLDENQN